MREHTAAGVLTQQGIVYIAWAACAVKLCGIVAFEFVIGLFGDIAVLVIICVDAGDLSCCILCNSPVLFSSYYKLVQHAEPLPYPIGGQQRGIGG